MSKVRCPVCGAAHKTAPSVCRMCGYNMADHMGSLQVSDTGTKPIIRTRSGFGRPMLIALAGVVILAVAAVGLGFVATEDGETISGIRQKVPGIGPEVPDGWTTVDVEAGGFSVQFPQVNEESLRALAVAPDGRVPGIDATAGDTVIFAGSAEVEPSSDEADDRLEAYAVDLLGVPADDFDVSRKISFLGFRALQVQEEKEVDAGVYRTFNLLLFLDGDRLYLIETASKEDPAATTTAPPEEFDRVAESFTLAPADAA